MKNEDGAYQASSSIIQEESVSDSTPSTDVSIDSMLLKGLTIIDRMMRIIMMDVSSGSPSRESVMNLKDCMNLLQTMKQNESEILDIMTTEQLEEKILGK